MKITNLGHACVSIELSGKHLLIDPFISPNPLAKDIDIESLKPDYILITHGHEDHVADVERIAKNNSNVLLISNYEIISWFANKGLKGHPLNHGGKMEFDFGTVKYVAAVHSSVLPDGTYGGNPGGFVIYNNDTCVYVAGDTALTKDMELLPLICPKIDVAILPIGDNFTMGIEDAAICSEMIDCSKIMGCHYDTFPPIKIDSEKSILYFKERNKELLLPPIGQSIQV